VAACIAALPQEAHALVALASGSAAIAAFLSLPQSPQWVLRAFADAASVSEVVNHLQQLQALGNVQAIDLYISSEGGDVATGLAMYAMLERHPATITAYVDGYAYSIASVIRLRCLRSSTGRVQRVA
jgi:ATP-dependent protease ClpP protease subunit